MTSTSKTALLNRRLYRAVLRAAKPFTSPSPNSVVLSCLLHRSFIPLAVDESLARRHRDEDYALVDPQNIESYPMADHFYPEVEDEEAADPSSPQRHDAHFLLLRRLLWTIFSGGYSYTPSPEVVPCYLYPKQMREQPHKLRDIIRQEFRVPDSQVEEYVVASPSNKQPPTGYLSAAFPLKARRDAAFLALRRLNEKLAWADQLEASKRTAPRSPKQAAKHVEPVWEAMGTTKGDECNISTLLTPGMFLVAHPHLTGCFRQAVVCILQHCQEDESGTDDNSGNEKSKETGTYGIVVNRPSLLEATGRNRTLADALHFGLSKVSPLGAALIRDGGPVHMPSIQMLYTPGDRSEVSDTHTGGQDLLKEIGGTRLPSVTGLADEKLVCYQGDIEKAAEAVASGHLDQGTFAWHKIIVISSA